MKKVIMVIILVISAITIKAQNHFVKSMFFDVSAGLTDMLAIEPNIGAGYNLNEDFSLCGRYAYKTTSSFDKYRFTENSLDLYAKYVLYNCSDIFGINIFAGISQSINNLSLIPRPNFNPKVYNIGYIGGIEYEYFFNDKIAFFSSINSRAYYLDHPHYEFSYQFGIRADLTVFSKYYY
jgi:hypothetical protein